MKFLKNEIIKEKQRMVIVGSKVPMDDRERLMKIGQGSISEGIRRMMDVCRDEIDKEISTVEKKMRDKKAS